jgi:hypothetical protein
LLWLTWLLCLSVWRTGDGRAVEVTLKTQH